MATAKNEARPILKNVSASMQRVSGDVASAVATLGRKVTGLLPEEQREQVDRMLEGIFSVRGDASKTLEGIRSELEDRFDVVRGTISTGVSSIRTEIKDQRKWLDSVLQKELRSSRQRVFKWLRLPAERDDVNAIKRQLSALARRLKALENSEVKRRAGA